MTRAATVAARVGLGAWTLWCVAALVFAGPGAGWLRWLLVVALVGLVVYVVRRPAHWPALPVALLAVLTWFLLISPTHDRDWSPDQVRLSWAEIDGTKVTVKNIRNFRYRDTDDWDAGWYDATFDTDDLEHAWFVVEPFSQFEGAAHTMVSFGFKGGRYLVMSVEIRKEKGESFSVLGGMFRRYELQYVAGDERDLIQLRSNHRKDDVYLHPMMTGRRNLVAYFMSMMTRMNALKEAPEFYNTLTSSCTTNLVTHLKAISDAEVSSWDYRILLPGYSAEVAYDLGLLGTDLTLEEVRKRDKINERAMAFADREDFSAGIRQ